jgi:hypothetical protein
LPSKSAFSAPISEIDLRSPKRSGGVSSDSKDGSSTNDCQRERDLVVVALLLFLLWLVIVIVLV